MLPLLECGLVFGIEALGFVMDEVAEDFETVSLLDGLLLEKFSHIRDPDAEVLQLGVTVLQLGLNLD
jgi:hypothetical protein